MTLAYLSAPIIHSTLRKDDFCTVVIKAMEDKGVEVFAPQLSEENEPDFIYKRDITKLRACDLLVAEVSSPSHGVGMEVMLAIELMKPVLMFIGSSSTRISKMVLGADGKALFKYESLKDVDRIIRSMNLENLIVRKCRVCCSQVAEVAEDTIRCVACSSTDRNLMV